MIDLIRKTLIHPLKARLRERRIHTSARTVARMNRNAFPGTFNLPIPYARGLNERAVELAFAQLLYSRDQEVLDIGHANAKPSHLAFLSGFTCRENLTGIDIGQPVYDATRYYKQSVRADIVNHPFPENSFDVIWCISTLEHFGMDIATYNEDFTLDDQLPARALRAMLRILKPGGRILLTVPFGRYENHGWFINYDAAHWRALIDHVRNQARISEWYFAHDGDSGWRLVTGESLANTGYHDQANYGAAGLAVAVIEKPGSGKASR